MNKKDSDLPGFEEFSSDCNKIATDLITILNAVLAKEITAREGLNRVAKIVAHIDSYVGTSDERKLLCVPMYAFCNEVNSHLIKKMS